MVIGLLPDTLLSVVNSLIICFGFVKGTSYQNIQIIFPNSYTTHVSIVQTPLTTSTVQSNDGYMAITTYCLTNFNLNIYSNVSKFWLSIGY